jgi:hypothetical protein
MVFFLSESIFKRAEDVKGKNLLLVLAKSLKGAVSRDF